MFCTHVSTYIQDTVHKCHFTKLSHAPYKTQQRWSEKKKSGAPSVSWFPPGIPESWHPGNPPSQGTPRRRQIGWNQHDVGSQIWPFSTKKKLVHGILVKHSLDMFNPTVLRHLRIFVDARFVFDALGPVCIPTRAMMHHGTGRRLQRMTRSNPLWTTLAEYLPLWYRDELRFFFTRSLWSFLFSNQHENGLFLIPINLPLLYHTLEAKKYPTSTLKEFLTQSTLTSRRSRHSCSPPASGYFIASRLVASAWHPCG